MRGDENWLTSWDLPGDTAHPRCRKCAEHVEYREFAPMLAVLSDSTWDPPGVWQLAPVTAWGLRNVVDRVVPVLQLGAPTTKAVDLVCPRCRTRTTWRAKTLSRRVTALNCSASDPLLPDRPLQSRY